MRRDRKEYIRNVNFWFKFVEMVACMIGFGLRSIDISYLWCVLGCYGVSNALLVAYLYEQPNFGLEVILMVCYFFPMTYALWDLSVKNLPPAIISIIMFIDLVFLVTKRNRDPTDLPTE